MTTTIRAKDVLALREFSVEEFHTWLREGLGTYFGVRTVQKDHPFEPYTWVPSTGEEIDDVLSQIYFALDPPARVRFLSALRTLPLSFSDDADWYPVLREILYLFVNIRETAVAEDVVNAVDCDAFRGLFPEALAVVEMLVPGRGAAPAIARLACSTRFPPELSTRAFVALCRCDPRRWVSHVDLLAGRWASVVDLDLMDPNYLRRAFAETVSIDLVALGIKTLHANAGLKKISSGRESICLASKHDLLRMLFVLFSGTLTFEYFPDGVVIVTNENSRKEIGLKEATLEGDRFIRELDARLRRHGTLRRAQELAVKEPALGASFQAVHAQLTLALSVKGRSFEEHIETLLDIVSR